MKTKQKPLAATIDPETRQLLASKMDAYLRRFGGNKIQQELCYTRAETGIFRKVGKKETLKKFSFRTIYKFALVNNEVGELATFAVMSHFGIKHCEKTWEDLAIIKHVENGEK